MPRDKSNLSRFGVEAWFDKLVSARMTIGGRLSLLIMRYAMFPIGWVNLTNRINGSAAGNGLHVPHLGK